MKKIFSIITVIVLAITLVACNTGNSEGTLVVGLEADYPPFNWMDTTSNDTNYPIDGMPNAYADGYDVQMAIHIADELGMELVIKMIEWRALIPALESGEIDLIIAGMSPTADRLLSIDFTEAYYTSNHVALVLSDGPLANATTLADLEGTTGVGQTSTSYENIVAWLAENHGVNLLPTSIDTVPDIITAITLGDADFTIVEEPVADGLIARHPELKMILNFPTDVNIFEVDEADRIVSIGMRKGTEDLRTEINEILSNITDAQRNEWMADAVSRAE